VQPDEAAHERAAIRAHEARALGESALGLRAAVWLAALAPVWMLGRAQTIDELAPPARTELLDRMLGHRAYAVRGPATLLKLGTPDEVSAYCRKLIDVVGEGSGFVLSSGCSVPVDARLDNVKAMVDTARNYNPHRATWVAV
jgi:hypothetical protein